jgi:CrcB protein
VINPLLAIAAGASMGAWARWGLGVLLNPLNGSLPIGTLTANLLGGYGVGLAIAWFAQHLGLMPAWRLLVITGFLGGLTTVSTFSAEVIHLTGRQDYGWALAASCIGFVGHDRIGPANRPGLARRTGLKEVHDERPIP